MICDYIKVCASQIIVCTWKPPIEWPTTRAQSQHSLPRGILVIWPVALLFLVLSASDSSIWMRIYPSPVLDASVRRTVWSLGSKCARHWGPVMMDLTISMDFVWLSFHTKAFFFCRSPFIGSIECLRSGEKSENWFVNPINDRKSVKLSGLGN